MTTNSLRNEITDIYILKDINIKTLVSGDKTARIVLETTSSKTISKLKEIAEEILVKVTIGKDE